MTSDLFKRVPTDDEKRYYRVQWGGVPPHRVVFGMMFTLALGFLAGYVISACPGTECQVGWVKSHVKPAEAKRYIGINPP